MSRTLLRCHDGVHIKVERAHSLTFVRLSARDASLGSNSSPIGLLEFDLSGPKQKRPLRGVFVFWRARRDGFGRWRSLTPAGRTHSRSCVCRLATRASVRTAALSGCSSSTSPAQNKNAPRGAFSVLARPERWIRSLALPHPCGAHSLTFVRLSARDASLGSNSSPIGLLEFDLSGPKQKRPSRGVFVVLARPERWIRSLALPHPCGARSRPFARLSARAASLGSNSSPPGLLEFDLSGPKQKRPSRGVFWFWRARRDSNSRPPGSKPDTLSN